MRISDWSSDVCSSDLFTSPEDAEASPLASALFSLGDVTGVFYGRDFISVTKAEGSADWQELKPLALGILVDHFEAVRPCFRGAARTPSISRRTFRPIIRKMPISSPRSTT